MANARAVIDIDINASPAAAELRRLQSQINGFSAALNKANTEQGLAAKGMARQISDLVNSSKFFTAETVRMQTSAAQLDNTLKKGQVTMGQFFSARFRKDGLAAAQVLSLANARAAALETQFIQVGAAAGGMKDALAIRPLQAFNSAVAVNTQKLAIHRAMLQQATTSMINFGKNTQWAGRQLMVGFTVPLTIFAGVAGKTFRDLDKEATNFRKVYGDIFTTDVQTEEALEGVKALSAEFTKYGVEAKKTMELAAIAAQAGQQGAQLMAATTQATRLAVLGDMENQDAMRTTIALQSAFKMSSEDLAESINFLNMVENQSVLSLQDVSEAIPRVAPVIQGLGGDVKDLAVMLVAMREGGVGATDGANGLKSSLGRLISPTKQASDMARSFGINLEDIVAKNAGDVLGTVMQLATAMKSLGEIDQQRLLSTIFGKFQYARIGALFENITREGSQAQRVIELMGMSTADMAASAEKELSAIEQSVSVKFTAAMERLKVAIAPIGELFTKMALPIINFFSKIAEKFNELPDFAKNFLALGTVITGIVIPAGTMFLGLLMNLIGTLVKFGHLIGIAFKGFMSGGIKGAFDAVSQAVRYMSLAEIDASNAAQQLAGTTQAVNAALLDQVTRAETSTAAIMGLAGAYDILVQNMRESMLIGGLPMAVPGQAGMRAGRSGLLYRPLPIVARNKGGSIPYLSDGGRPTVPGVGNRDTVPAMLTPGEFVVNKQATQQNLGLLHAINDGNVQYRNKGGGIAEMGRKFYGPRPNPYALAAQQARERLEQFQGSRSAIASHFGLPFSGPSARAAQQPRGSQLNVARRSEDIFDLVSQKDTKAARLLKKAVDLGISPRELRLKQVGNLVLEMSPSSNMKMANGNLTRDGLIAELSHSAVYSPLDHQLRRYFGKSLNSKNFDEIYRAQIDLLPETGITNQLFEKATRNAVRIYLDQNKFAKPERNSFLRDILAPDTIRANMRKEEIRSALNRNGIDFNEKGDDIIAVIDGETYNFGDLAGRSIDYMGRSSGLTRYDKIPVSKNMVRVHANKGGMIPGVQYFNAAMAQRVVQAVRQQPESMHLLRASEFSRNPLIKTAMKKAGQRKGAIFVAKGYGLGTTGVGPKSVNNLMGAIWDKNPKEARKLAKELKVPRRLWGDKIPLSGSDAKILRKFYKEYGKRTGLDVEDIVTFLNPKDYDTKIAQRIALSNAKARSAGKEISAEIYEEELGRVTRAFGRSKTTTGRLNGLIREFIIDPKTGKFKDDIPAYSVEGNEHFATRLDLQSRRNKRSSIISPFEKSKKGTAVYNAISSARMGGGRWSRVSPEVLGIIRSLGMNAGGQVPGVQYLFGGGGVRALSRAAQLRLIRERSGDPFADSIEDVSLRSIFNYRFNDIKADTPSSFVKGMFSRWEAVPTRISPKENTTMLLKGKKPRYPAISQEEYLADMIMSGDKFSDVVDAFKPISLGPMWNNSSDIRVFDGHTRIHAQVTKGLIKRLLGRDTASMSKEEIIDAIRLVQQKALADEITDKDVLRATAGQRILTKKPMRSSVEKLFERPGKQQAMESMYNRAGRTLIPGIHDREIEEIVNAAKSANFYGVGKDPNSLMKAMGFVSLGDETNRYYRYEPGRDFRNRSSYVNNMSRRIVDDLIDRKAILPLRRNKGGMIPGVQYRNMGGEIFESAKKTIVPGVGNTDTVPAALTPGEFVVNKQATQQNKPLLQAINSGKMIGFNKGGMIPGVQYFARNMLQRVVQPLRSASLITNPQQQRHLERQLGVWLGGGMDRVNVRELQRLGLAQVHPETELFRGMVLKPLRDPKQEHRLAVLAAAGIPMPPQTRRARFAPEIHEAFYRYARSGNPDDLAGVIGKPIAIGARSFSKSKKATKEFSETGNRDDASFTFKIKDEGGIYGIDPYQQIGRRAQSSSFRENRRAYKKEKEIIPIGSPEKGRPDVVVGRIALDKDGTVVIDLGAKLSRREIASVTKEYDARLSSQFATKNEIRKAQDELKIIEAEYQRLVSKGGSATSKEAGNLYARLSNFQEGLGASLFNLRTKRDKRVVQSMGSRIRLMSEELTTIFNRAKSLNMNSGGMIPGVQYFNRFMPQRVVQSASLAARSAKRMGLSDLPEGQYDSMLSRVFRQSSIEDLDGTSLSAFRIGRNDKDYIFKGYNEVVPEIAAKNRTIVGVKPEDLVREALKHNPKDPKLVSMLSNLEKGTYGRKELRLIDNIASSISIDKTGRFSGMEQTSGYALVLASLMGDQNASRLVRMQREAFYRNVKESQRRQKNAASASADPSQEASWEDRVFIHSTSRGVNIGKDGTAKIYSAGDATRGTDQSVPRSTVHTTINAPVESHLGGTWSDTNQLIVGNARRVLASNRNPVIVGATDTAFPVNPGEAVRFPKASIVTPSNDESSYRANLITRGMLKEGQETPFIVEDPKSNQVFYFMKENSQYTDADRIRILKSLGRSTSESAIKSITGKETELLKRESLKKAMRQQGSKSDPDTLGQWGSSTPGVDQEIWNLAARMKSPAAIHQGSPSEILEMSAIKGSSYTQSYLYNRFGDVNLQAIRHAIASGHSKTSRTAPKFDDLLYNKGGFISPTLQMNSGNMVPGVGNTDTVPAMLTPGEFVVNKKASMENLALLHAINSGQRLNNGGQAKGIQYLNRGGQSKVGIDTRGNPIFVDEKTGQIVYRNGQLVPRSMISSSAMAKINSFGTAPAAAASGAGGGGGGAGMGMGRFQQAMMRGMGPSMAIGMGGMGVQMIGAEMQNRAAQQGTVSPMGSTLTTVGAGLSMGSMLAFLPGSILGPLAAVAAPIAAIAGGAAIYENHMNNAAQAAADFATKVNGTIHPLERMGDLLGLATPAKRRAQISLGVGQDEAANFQQQFGEVFSTEQGAMFIDELNNASSPERFKKLSDYLKYSIAAGFMDREAAKTFARVISAELGDSFLGARTVSAISKQAQGSDQLLALAEERDINRQSQQMSRVASEESISVQDSAAGIANSIQGLQDYANAAAFAFEELSEGKISIQQYQDVVDKSRQKQGEYTKTLSDAIEKTGHFGGSMQVLRDQFMKMGFEEGVFEDIENNLRSAGTTQARVVKESESAAERIGTAAKGAFSLDSLNPFNNFSPPWSDSREAREGQSVTEDVLPYVVAAVAEGMNERLAQNIAIDLLIKEGGLDEEFEKTAERFGAKLALESEVVLKQINSGELVDLTPSQILGSPDILERKVEQRKNKVSEIFEAFRDRGGEPEQFLTWIESIPDEKRFDLVVEFGGLSSREQQEYLADASAFGQAYGQDFQIAFQQSAFYKDLLGRGTTESLREAINFASGMGLSESVINFAIKESNENTTAEELANRITSLTNSFVRLETLPEELTKTLRINLESGVDLERFGEMTEELEMGWELLDNLDADVPKELIANAILLDGDGQVRSFDDMAYEIGNLSIAYKSLEGLSPTIRKQAIIDIATTLGEGDPNAILGRVLEDIPDFYQLEGGQQSFILQQYGQAFNETQTAQAALEENERQRQEILDQRESEPDHLRKNDYKQEELDQLEQERIALEKLTEGELAYQQAKAASIASGAGFTVPAELMGALGLSYTGDIFKENAEDIASGWAIMQGLPSDIDLNFVARFMIFGTGDKPLKPEDVAKQGKIIRKAFEDLESKDPEKRKKAQETIGLAYAVQVMGGTQFVDEEGNAVGPEEIRNQAFEELRAQFPDFDKLDIDVQGAMITSRIDYIVEGAELAAKNALLEQQMAAALARGDGETASRISAQISKNNARIGQIEAEQEAVSEVQYRKPTKNTGGGGQKSLSDQLKEQLKNARDIFNSINSVINEKGFKSFIAGPFAPEFLEYLRNQGEEGLKILKGGIDKIKKEYDKFKQIRMLEIGAQAAIAPLARRDELQALRRQGRFSDQLRGGTRFGMGGQGLFEEEVSYVMEQISPDDLATLNYLESKSELNEEEEEILRNIRQNIRDAVAKAPKIAFESNVQGFKTNMQTAEEGINHLNSIISRGIDPELAQSMVEMGVTSRMVANASAEDFENWARRVKSLNLAQTMQQIAINISDMGRQIGLDSGLMAMGYTGELAEELKQVGVTLDMLRDKPEVVRAVAAQLTALKMVAEGAKDPLQRISEQLDLQISALQAQMEKYERTNIKPLQDALDIINQNIRQKQRDVELEERKKEQYQDNIETLQDEQESLQETYDERIKALEKVSNINERIARQQKSQLDVASALSRGDIAGAAAAALQAKQEEARQRIEETRNTITTQYESEREALDERIKENRLEIEGIDDRIKQIQMDMRDLQDAAYNKQLEIDAAKKEQLKTEEKIYKAQLLQNIVQARAAVLEAARSGNVEKIKQAQSGLGAVLTTAGGTQEERDQFFAGIEGAGQITSEAAATVATDPQVMVAQAFNALDQLLEEIKANSSSIIEKLMVSRDMTEAEATEFYNRLLEEGGGPAQIITALSQAGVNLIDMLGIDATAEGNIPDLIAQIGDSNLASAQEIAQMPALAVGMRKAFEGMKEILDGKIKEGRGIAAEINSAIAAWNSRPKDDNQGSEGKGQDGAKRRAFGGYFAFGGMINYRGSTEPAPGMMYGGKMKKYAYGSFVPGVGMTDKVPALLTPGEFVVRKSVASQYGPLLTALNSNVFPKMNMSGPMPRSSSNTKDGIQYNYDIDVNVAGTNASPDEIAQAVMYRIKRIDDRQVRGTKLG